MKKIPLYIHIPFCRSKCSYCNFYSHTGYSLQLEKKVLKEISLQIKYYMELTKSKMFKTVYIGGGTPSMLSLEGLEYLLDFLKKYNKYYTNEFTIECNPEDISENFLKLLDSSQVNRISLGVQSFNNNILEKSGRKSNTQTLDNAIILIKKFWKKSFSVDLISGLPGQNKKSQIEDIKKAIGSGADHISCYSLILDKNTPLFNEFNQNDEEEEKMWITCYDYLIKNGFSHYEISNFSKVGKESIHNLQYWEMNEYIGCGPGAVSMIFNNGIERISNPKNIDLYLSGKAGNWSVSSETINNLDFLFENYMMGLRTKYGINKNTFLKRFGSTPESFITETLNNHSEETFKINDSTFSLSDKVRLFMNPLLIEIFDELLNTQKNITINWP